MREIIEEMAENRESQPSGPDSSQMQDGRQDLSRQSPAAFRSLALTISSLSYAFFA